MKQVILNYLADCIDIEPCDNVSLIYNHGHILTVDKGNRAVKKGNDYYEVTFKKLDK